MIRGPLAQIGPLTRSHLHAHRNRNKLLCAVPRYHLAGMAPGVYYLRLYWEAGSLDPAVFLYPEVKSGPAAVSSFKWEQVGALIDQ